MDLPADPDDKTYLYLRTPRDVWKEDELLDILGEYCPALDDYHDPSSEWYLHSQCRGTELLFVTREIDHWEDGFVLRLTCSEPFDESVDLLRPALDNFEAWTLHDGRTRCVEKDSGGPAQRFFTAARIGGVPQSVTQIFLVFHDEDLGARSEAVRRALAARADWAPVFHFRNGKILLMSTNEPGTIICRRYEPYLRNLAGWAICDGAGVTRTPEDVPLHDQRFEHRPWMGVDLQNWTFATEEQESQMREWEELFKS